MAKEERPHVLSDGCWCHPILIVAGRPTPPGTFTIAHAEPIVEITEDGEIDGWRAHVEMGEGG